VIGAQELVVLLVRVCPFELQVKLMAWVKKGSAAMVPNKAKKCPRT
jgi:hypothetical protein